MCHRHRASLTHIFRTISEYVSVFVRDRADGEGLAVEKVCVVGYKLKPRKQKRQNTRITDNLRTKPLLHVLIIAVHSMQQYS